MKVMIVEDDISFGEELKYFLKNWEFDVVQATDYGDIIGEFKKINPQLVLLDINLPFYDGLYWCQEIRRISKVPIIFISSRKEDTDKIMGMVRGADDYLEKPFTLDLLKAKIDAILRRSYEYNISERIYIEEKLFYDLNIDRLYYEDREIELTKSENIVIKKLVDNKSKVVSREELMNTLWSTEEFISDTTLSVLISRLRSKLNDFIKQEIIKTKKGQGYYIE